MKSIKTLALAGALSLAWAITPALGAGFFTNGVPPAGGTQYPTTLPLTGNELVPADTGLPSGLNPASESITTNQLAGFLGGQATPTNFLIGGDAGTNLFQRGTTGASETTTFAYGGPDRWAYWSGTSTAMTVSKDTTAGDLPTSGYQAGFKMARTSGQTGLVQMCMAQEVSTQNSTAMQGQTVELDFHAFTGANFSPANAAMTAYIVTGTGTDEGMQKLAFGLNAGGGGSTGWTGQANATAAVTSLGAVSTLGRYAAVAAIPTTATEVGVALCWTPVGTAGTNDYVTFAGVQLVRNNANTKYISATVGYNDALNNFPAAAFQRRLAADEQVLQQQYYYQITEATGPSVIANCRAHSVTVQECFVPFPVTMRALPTMTYTAGFATETTAAGGTLGTCSALATATTVASTAAAVSGIEAACTATTVPAAGVAGFLFNNGNSGAIKASAEL